MRLGNTRLYQLAVVAAGILALGASDALARSRGSWGSHGGYGSAGSYSGGSYGGSSASYGSGGSYASYSSSYGSAGSSGSYGRPGLFARWHARKAARNASYGSYGSAGGYSGGSSGGAVVSYGSYGSAGSSGSYGGSYYDSVPGEVTAPEVAVPTEPSASATEATIFVKVPADAKVFVNDLATTSIGADRHYVSRGLQGGRSYSYKLRVEFERDGKTVSVDKLVRLQAGQNTELAFGGAQTADQKTAQTELKLHVPANAKVTLAGAATEQVGDVRSYTTDSLNLGQKWEGYTVRVELEQDGKTLVEEKTLSIEGGKTYELAFELADDALKVAAN